MRRLTPLLLLITTALPSGCAAGLAEVSAEPTGCALEDIEVSDAHVPFLGQGAPTQWTATCGGVRHFCIQTPDRVICTTDPRSSDEPSAAG